MSILLLEKWVFYAKIGEVYEFMQLPVFIKCLTDTKIEQSSTELFDEFSEVSLDSDRIGNVTEKFIRTNSDVKIKILKTK